MLAYENALLWRELFELARLQRVDHEEIIAMAYRVTGMHFFHDNHVNINDCLTDDLTSKKRYTEAGHILLYYAEDDRRPSSD
jgi:elongator complex protein 1